MVDDYAHHPTEVAALLTAARPVAAGGRVLVLFQPHLYSRTRLFAQEFADALALADDVVVTGVYAAREDLDAETGSWTVVDRMPAARPAASRTGWRPRGRSPLRRVLATWSSPSARGRHRARRRGARRPRECCSSG
ncbi:cyanophycin synthetase [Oerskovia sp. M15]